MKSGGNTNSGIPTNKQQEQNAPLCRFAEAIIASVAALLSAICAALNTMNWNCSTNS